MARELALRRVIKDVAATLVLVCVGARTALVERDSVGVAFGRPPSRVAAIVVVTAIGLVVRDTSVIEAYFLSSAGVGTEMRINADMSNVRFMPGVLP